MLLRNEQYFEYVRHAIGEARRRVYVCQFKIEPGLFDKKDKTAGLLRALVEKRKAGVDVKVLLNNSRTTRQIKSLNLFAAREMRGAGIEVKSLGVERIVHAKLVLVDDKIAVVGSHNWCRNSLSRNFEMSCVAVDILTVNALAKYFLETFALAEKFKLFL